MTNIICLDCGDQGYYRKATMSGRTQFCYEPDGSQGDDTGLHDGIEYHEQKTMYCLECDRNLGVHKD